MFWSQGFFKVIFSINFCFLSIFTQAQTHLVVKYLVSESGEQQEETLEIGTNKSVYYYEVNDEIVIKKIETEGDIGENSQPVMTGLFGSSEELNVTKKLFFVKDYTSSILLSNASLDPFSESNGEEVLIEEKIPAIDWDIFDEEKMIADTYHCKKAVGDFRGRTYTVWFTEEIPIPNGPWKFGGLPGLILEVEEKNGYCFFNFISLKQPKQGVDINTRIKEIGIDLDVKKISWAEYKPIIIKKTKEMSDFLFSRLTANDNNRFDDNSHTHSKLTTKIKMREQSILEGIDTIVKEQQ